MLATNLAQAAQVVGDLAVAADRAALQPRLLDHAQETLIFDMAIAMRLALPRIKPLRCTPSTRMLATQNSS